MRYLSVCSGIEAASVAWHGLGWKPLAFSEIEAFPRAVLKHHYPDVPLHGDFTRLRDQPWIADADVLVAGTPCQAFSVAGLRNSLSDERGNLSLEFIRLANAIDDFRRDAGRPPAYVLWENVPGILSVWDNAFGSFLAGLVGHDAPILPPRGRGWTESGVVSGPRRVAAWRCLDAQHFGLAQRRKRIFVLAVEHPRGWAVADALLPIIDSVSGHFAPSRKTGKDASISPTLRAGGNRTGGDRPPGTDVDTVETLQVVSAFPPDVARCVTSSNQRIDWETETFVAHSLRAEGFDASEDGTGRGTPRVPVLAGTLKANNGGGGWSNSADHAASGYMIPVHAFDARQSDVIQYGDMTGPLDTDGHSDAVSVAFQPRFVRNGRGAPDKIASPLTAQAGSHGDSAQCVAFQSSRSGVREVETHATLDANNGGRRHNGVVQQSAVRRLTPVECARLQGFPDSYLTSVTWRGSCPPPDGPMYKALGNSFAVPVVRWIGERIQHVEEMLNAPVMDAAE
jgi:DNA (cytosine-5)-methyltransferase 1